MHMHISQVSEMHMHISQVSEMNCEMNNDVRLSGRAGARAASTSAVGAGPSSLGHLPE